MSDSWEQQMADRAKARRPADPPKIDRNQWPGPSEHRGYSARDAFLWYIVDAWPKFWGGDERVEAVFDHDFGKHVLRLDGWELTLVNVEEFPEDAWGRDTDA
jgi:hypothetical protein